MGIILKGISLVPSPNNKPKEKRINGKCVALFSARTVIRNLRYFCRLIEMKCPSAIALKHSK